MRFLCLHGAGTNSEIFSIQSGGLRQALETKGHLFTFANGNLPANVVAELEGIVDGPFYNHYPRSPALPSSSLDEAFQHVYQIIKEKGPFDAIMGFSQGAALSAALIIHHAKTNPDSPPLFRAAVFLCAGAPWESSGLEYIMPKQDEFPITIPTAHIVGKQDDLYDEGVRLFRLCEPANASFYDHGSKHLVPFDQKNTDAMIKTIEETIAKAMRG